jgi:hypothetical protein
MTRKLGTAVLAVSLLWAVGSLAIKGGVGVSQAQLFSNFSSNFSITRASAEITHETAVCTNNNNSFVSCDDSQYYHSDSYNILANLVLSNVAGFQQALNQSIGLVLAPGNCSILQQSLGWIGFVPGGSLHKVSIGPYTAYSLEANIPGFAEEGQLLFDNAVFNLVMPMNTHAPNAIATMALQGNAGLCFVNGPMAFEVFLGNGSACVNIPTPKLDTLDISSAYCEIG